jgi:hypothetical protein
MQHKNGAPVDTCTSPWELTIKNEWCAGQKKGVMECRSNLSKQNREFNVYFQDVQTFYHADHTKDEAEFVDLHKLFYMTYYNEITNGCSSLFYVFISFLLIFTLYVSGSHKPIISGISSCFLIYNHLVHVVFMLFICVCPWFGLSSWFHCTVWTT